MTAFQYHALNNSGESKKGIIEADSERQARDSIRQQGLIPTQIQLVKGRKGFGRSNRLHTADLALLTRQMATLLSAGIPIDEALQGVIEQTEKNKVVEILIGLRAKVVQGYSLAQAMGEYPAAFPELYRATVGSGEQTGQLDFVLLKLAEYTEQQQANRQKAIQALIYPSLMILVSIGIIGFLLAYVVPKIIDVFISSGQSLPTMTKVLIDLSHFLQHYGIFLLVGLIGITLLCRYALTYESWLWRWHHLKLRLPITSYLIRSSNNARYIHTFAILFSAGVSVLETMRVGSQLISNVVMRKAFDQAAIKVKEGTSISQSLKETGFLNPMAIHLISSGERSGQVAELMEKAAIHMDNELKRLIDTALTLLEPMVILFMGAVVLFIVLATLLPIFSMEQLIS
jgi:general secretion pathway protein F